MFHGWKEEKKEFAPDGEIRKWEALYEVVPLISFNHDVTSVSRETPIVLSSLSLLFEYTVITSPYDYHVYTTVGM